MMTDVENEAAAKVYEVPRQDSVLATYCKTAEGKGSSECLWICYPKHDRRLVKDIVIGTEEDKTKETEFRLCDLVYQYGWWKQFSIYSAIGVKEVEVCQIHAGSGCMDVKATAKYILCAIEKDAQIYQARLVPSVSLSSHEDFSNLTKYMK
jgi:hypothetical protein